MNQPRQRLIREDFPTAAEILAERVLDEIYANRPAPQKSDLLEFAKSELGLDPRDALVALDLMQQIHASTLREAGYTCVAITIPPGMRVIYSQVGVA